MRLGCWLARPWYWAVWFWPLMCETWKPGTRRSTSGMSIAPEASMVSRSMMVIAAGDSETGCARRLAESTTGVSDRK